MSDWQALDQAAAEGLVTDGEVKQMMDKAWMRAWFGTVRTSQPVADAFASDDAPF
jgi:hypothetical protein